MHRSIALSGTARWWGSTLYQTTTLELVRGEERLLVDPGVAPWEIAEAADGHVEYVVLTHADWDHVLGVGILATAEVVAGSAAAERIAAPGAAAELEREAAEFYVPVRDLERLRVDRVVEPPEEIALGPWTAAAHPAPGHTADGIALSFPDERLLVVGDYLSPLEIPSVWHSAEAYKRTLELLIDLIGRERPAHVVSGHGRPQPAAAALAVAHEDLAYVTRLADLADEDEAARIEYPRRNVLDAREHEANVERLLEAG